MSEEISLFVPGRLCLFGEHSDWAGAWRAQSGAIDRGEAIVTGIPLGLYANVRRSDRFELVNPSGQRFECAMTCALDTVAAGGGFDSYAAGTAAYIREEYPKICGASIRILSQTLPLKRGLSSSAAVCLMVARSFNQLYGLGMTLEEEMLAAYRGERRTPSLCGRMDQALAYGIRPVHMLFDGARVESGVLTMGGDFHIVVAALSPSKGTVRILNSLSGRTHTRRALSKPRCTRHWGRTTA
jgi:galactokinase